MPVAVILNRFLTDDLVFSFGILVSYTHNPSEPGLPNIGAAAGHAYGPGLTRFTFYGEAGRIEGEKSKYKGIGALGGLGQDCAMSAKPPDAGKLYEAALNHLARYPATETGMVRVLARKVDRWARLYAGEDADPAEVAGAARGAKAAIPSVIVKLKAAGVLNDDAFAASRAKRLTREGKSRRGALAHLAAKGVAGATAAKILADNPERELAAACAYLRRRRAGPFGDAPELKILAAMARGGFSQEVARRALRLDREEAEDRIKSLHE